MIDLQYFTEKITAETAFAGELRFNEIMALHSTFKVGGQADLWIKPDAEYFITFSKKLLNSAKAENIPVFILGGGSNIVVSDKGIRGIVLDTGFWAGCDFSNNSNNVTIRSGTKIDKAATAVAEQGFGGMEFLAGIPGTIGGAIWMNASCYGKAISDILTETKILDEHFQEIAIPFKPEEFTYKKSPFQKRQMLILSATFSLEKREKEEITKEMEEHRLDRKNKGHYRYPSAGSAFKNNPEFGKPTGKIIDELGLKGFSVGGAQVAPWHGNIFINTGNATADDIRALTEEIANLAEKKLGIKLESEILFV